MREIPGLAELCLTTNGSRLEELAAPLRQAGVDRLNISLDTLRPERFSSLTRQGRLSDVLRGIAAAEEVAGGQVALTYFPNDGQVIYETSKSLQNGMAVRLEK